MAIRIQLRRDLAANWTDADPILAQGEFGIELDTNRLKIGDGSTNWVSLQYFTGFDSTGAIVTDPAGSNTQIQFNDNGEFGASSDLTFSGGQLYLASGTGINEFSTDGTLAGNSDDVVPTEQAVKTYVDNLQFDSTSYLKIDASNGPITGNLQIGTNDSTASLTVKGDVYLLYGTNINEFSTDGTLLGNSDDAVPTEKAVKTYITNEINSLSDEYVQAEDGLLWDDVLNRLGVNTSPNHTLDVGGDANFDESVTIGVGDTTSYLTIGNGTSINEFSADGTLSDNSDIAIPTEKAVKTYVDNAIADSTSTSYWSKTGDDVYYIGGNVGIGTSTQFGSGDGVMGISDAVTPPTTNTTGGGVLYSENGAGKWRGTSGTITTFGPADPHCPVCGKDYMLEFENGEDYLAVCINCMTKELGIKPWILTEKQ